VSIGADFLPDNRILYISGNAEYEEMYSGEYKISDIFASKTEVSGYVSSGQLTSKNVDDNYNVSVEDRVLYFNNSTPKVCVFPSPTVFKDRSIRVKTINTGIVTLSGIFGSGVTFDGSPTYILGEKYISRELHSNGSGWFIW